MTEINWALPLETDEPTPRPVTSIQAGGWDGFAARITVTFDEKDFVYREDGRPKRGQDGNPPCLRNVRALRTSDECLQRMEALVRRMAVRHETRPPGHVDPNDAEAAQIVKLLPTPPVDPDMIEARKILHASGGLSGDPLSILDGSQDKSASVALVLSALQRGRELAANGQ